MQVRDFLFYAILFFNQAFLVLLNESQITLQKSHLTFGESLEKQKPIHVSYTSHKKNDDLL